MKFQRIKLITTHTYVNAVPLKKWYLNTFLEYRTVGPILKLLDLFYENTLSFNGISYFILFKKEISIIRFSAEVKKIPVTEVVLYFWYFLYILPSNSLWLWYYVFLLSRYVIIYKRLFIYFNFICTRISYDSSLFCYSMYSTTTALHHRYWYTVGYGLSRQKYSAAKAVIIIIYLKVVLKKKKNFFPSEFIINTAFAWIYYYT